MSKIKETSTGDICSISCCWVLQLWRMWSLLCLCRGTNPCKSSKSPPVIFHNRPNVPVNVTLAEQNCNYILSSTRANISSTVNFISLIVIFCRQPRTIFLWLSTWRTFSVTINVNNNHNYFLVLFGFTLNHCVTEKGLSMLLDLVSKCGFNSTFNSSLDSDDGGDRDPLCA